MSKMRIYDTERTYLNDQYLAQFRIDPSGVTLSLDAMVEHGERIMNKQEAEENSRDCEDTK